MNWKQVCKLGKELPEVIEGTWYGMPSLEVRGKSFVGHRVNLDSIVLPLESVDEQELLIENVQKTYYITDHYRGYPAVLARLDALTAAECRFQLERAWRIKAPTRLAKERDGKQPPAKRRR
jgi:hypothetical protein